MIDLEQRLSSFRLAYRQYLHSQEAGLPANEPSAAEHHLTTTNEVWAAQCIRKEEMLNRRYRHKSPGSTANYDAAVAEVESLGGPA